MNDTTTTTTTTTTNNNNNNMNVNHAAGLAVQLRVNGALRVLVCDVFFRPATNGNNEINKATNLYTQTIHII